MNTAVDSVPTPFNVFQKILGSSFETDDDVGITPKKSSGGDNDYWLLFITHPKRLEPYWVECEDIIEAMEMTFQEGEAFKAIWRKCMLRMGLGKPDDSELRNSEKVAHFGQRMLAMSQKAVEYAE